MPDLISINNEILRDYEKIRNLNAAKLRARKNEITEKFPRIKEIDETLNSSGFRLAKLVLNNPENAKEMAQSLADTCEKLKKEKNEILTSNGYPKDYLDEIYTCPNCKDTGFIGSKKCSCFYEKFTEKAYGIANLSQNSQSESFECFDLRLYRAEPKGEEKFSPRENIENIYKICFSFAKSFDTHFSNLFLYGGTGLGKTFLLNSIAKEALSRGKTVIYITAKDLFSTVEKEKFQKSEDAELPSITDNITEADLFMLDDLGTEFNTILTSSELFNIINSRLLEKKSTVISTNLSPKDLVNSYSDRVVSRILGSYKILKFFGEDIRLIKKFGK